MSGTRDTNWRSYVGPEDNGIIVDSIDWQAPLNPLDYDDLVKCSNCENLTIIGLDIPAAREDSIDFVRGKNYEVAGCTVHGSITIKGGIDGWRIRDCIVSGTIEVGQFDNYWKPGRLPTRNAVIENLNSPQRQRPRVKLWDATVPDIYASDVELIVVPRSIWLPYFLFRYAYIRSRARPAA